jgi:hypothetical protein
MPQILFDLKGEYGDIKFKRSKLYFKIPIKNIANWQVIEKLVEEKSDNEGSRSTKSRQDSNTS